MNIIFIEISERQYLGVADVFEYVGSWPYEVPPVHRIKPGRLMQRDCQQNFSNNKYKDKAFS